MAEINLKEYTNRAKELETAIYTQKRLMQLHEKLLKSQYPVAPKMRTAKQPAKPKKEDYHIDIPNSSIWFSLILMDVMGVMSLIMVFLDSNLFWICGILIGALGIILTKDELDKEKQIKIRNQELSEVYKQAQEEYTRQLAEYKQDLIRAKTDYEQAEAEYKVKVTQHNQKRDAFLLSHNSALSALENALETLYCENVIFPKYRNLVAVTAINEYLLSGRCYSLEGADGAYNLYEMELRQNIVIDQLSKIVSDLEQIRSNQYSLYEQLTRSNALVENIIQELRDIKSDTQLTAYFAELTALVSASPKFYISTSF